MIPLFERYPLLKEKLPYISLGEFPTPVHKLDRLGEDIGSGHLYVKRDDLSGRFYGGNKVRKLEFLLGKALRSKAREVLAVGYAGSNHCLATAFYAQQLGLKSISMLMLQPNADYVRQNLLMSYYLQAELHHHRNITSNVLDTVFQLMWHGIKYGRLPQFIPPGGSSPLGTVGFVNASFELKEQISKGEIPEPHYIYVAAGTMGTSAGLILGLKALNLTSRVIPVQIIDEKFINTPKMLKLISATNSLLCSLDSSFPALEFSEEDINIKQGFLGEKYALFTRAGVDAVTRMNNNEGIKLEGTYTGKTLAALIDDVEKQNLSNKVLLFWDTYNSRDFSNAAASVDYHQLPRRFHRYFEEDVQPLDRYR